MSTEPLTKDELYERYFPLPGHLPALSPEDEAAYERFFPGEARPRTEPSDTPTQGDPK
jgi:hypothetical protein